MTESVPKRILVVDDEETVRTVCFRMLKQAGYVVYTAADGDEAMALVKQHSFDLVLTDYRMPGTLSGLALGQAVRQHAPRTLLILMTAFPAIDAAVELLRIGGHDYLLKPFDQAELIRCVNACFAKSGAA